jgi:hypothetical protein
LLRCPRGLGAGRATLTRRRARVHPRRVVRTRSSRPHRLGRSSRTAVRLRRFPTTNASGSKRPVTSRRARPVPEIPSRRLRNERERRSSDRGNGLPDGASSRGWADGAPSPGRQPRRDAHARPEPGAGTDELSVRAKGAPRLSAIGGRLIATCSQHRAGVDSIAIRVTVLARIEDGALQPEVRDDRVGRARPEGSALSVSRIRSPRSMGSCASTAPPTAPSSLPQAFP